MPSDKHGYWFTEQYPIGPLTVNVVNITVRLKINVSTRVGNRHAKL